MAFGAIIAGAYGLGSAIFGAGQAHKAKRRAQQLIEQAYGISRAQQGLQQGDIRQGTTEALNARGLLTPGSGSSVAPAEAQPDRPYDPRQSQYTNGVVGSNPANFRPHDPIAPTALDTTRSTPAQRNAQHFADAAKGEVGPANTLAGQTERDLTGQFYLENKALDTQRQQLRAGVNAAAMQDTVNAIGSGIGNALTIYNAFQQQAPTSDTNIPLAARGPAVITGAFGLSPIDPVGSASQFNVLGG